MTNLINVNEYARVFLCLDRSICFFLIMRNVFLSSFSKLAKNYDNDRDGMNCFK